MTLVAENYGGDSVHEESDEGDGVGSPTGWGDFEELIGDWTPDVVVGVGDVLAFVAKGDYLFLACCCDVPHINL